MVTRFRFSVRSWSDWSDDEPKVERFPSFVEAFHFARDLEVESHPIVDVSETGRGVISIRRMVRHPSVRDGSWTYRDDFREETSK